MIVGVDSSIPKEGIPMSQVAEVIDQIEKLDPIEREQILTELSARFSPTMPYSNIVSTPGVCGGVPRIIRTRIPVWTLVRMRQLGVCEGEILRSYPTLRAIDLVQAWSYADNHREEMEKEIRENEED
jgi:uncharacterized protein (DUF433 family)